MQSKTYGDKQREAQQRKKQEELWKKSNPEAPPAPEAPKPEEPQKAEQPGKKPSKKKVS
jgi:hypothetical protein